MKTFAATWTAAIVLILIFTAATQADKRPNFVIIMADDLGYGDIGCYGNPHIATPALDKLAEQGMRFTDFHSSGAVCSPTRAGLMTGRYQQRAGVPGVIVADPKRPTHPHGLQDRERTLAEVFTGAGYETAIFGKWHLGYYKKYNPVRHGFKHFRGYISGNIDFFSHIDQAGRLDWWKNDQIADEPGYCTHLITKHAVRFIDDHKDKPFLLYLPYEPPHYPYQGPNDKAVRTVGKPRGKAETRQSADDIKRAYKEMVEEMDKGIGEVVARLDKHGIRENTFVLFFSDNGGTTRHGNNGGLRGGKGSLWEGGHRVACIANWPGQIKAGTQTDQLAISIDVMPTMMDIAGIKGPDGHQFDGVSLKSLLLEGKAIGHRKLFWQHGNQLAMRDHQWKLVLGGKGNPSAALFDLSKDRAEKNNLSAKQPERTKTMSDAVRAWLKEVNADAPAQPSKPPVE